MLKERNTLCGSLGKACLFSAVLCSAFVLARTFLQNDDKAAKKYVKRLRKAYDGLSPEDYSENESAKFKLTGKF
ncbi:MAG: hypothetical protein LBS61_06115 [Endomicrobium sp.]|jgi:hypothetical protein|nr:hypothetical protein [Endomicrobium sp.]